jgi:hypothetical protein
VGVSIYYTARRDLPLSDRERAAVSAARMRHPVESLIATSGVPEPDFDGEAFCVYSADSHTEPGVVFEGATKLPLYSEEAFWAAVQHWCRLLSEVRRGIPGAKWQVHVDDHDIPWVEERQVFDPSG